ncbi:MAG TPA: hypothetical protein VFG68_11090 [Fimbriiglobus sp.]|nr:hypothetical protein [Fimbriiglobus sp.]
MRVRTSVWAALLGGLFAAGCDGDTPTVRGRVTAHGKPVVWGSVTLVDARGGYHQALLDLDGNYEIDGVPTGAVKVGVVSDNPAGRVAGRGVVHPRAAGQAAVQDPREALGFRQDTGSGPPKPPPGAWFPIPERYGDPHSSGLTGEVKSGRASELNIVLR